MSTDCHNQADGQQPDTWFAPAGRSSIDTVRAEVEAASRSPVTGALMEAFGSLVALLNKDRQILVVNDGLLRFLGAKNTEDLLGLRPGEAVGCVHAHDHPGGCGTSKFCSTCGAAIAIVLAQESDAPQERECLLTVRRDEDEEPVELSVRAVPLHVEGEDFVLLLLSDIRDSKRRENLENLFRHDIMNTLTALMASAETLLYADPDKRSSLVKRVMAASESLRDEVLSQQLLTGAEDGTYTVRIAPVPLRDAVERLVSDAKALAIGERRTITVTSSLPEIALQTDPVLMHRVLLNMIKNALEATESGGEVRLAVDVHPEKVLFSVWNDKGIDETTSMRIFQRYFSTKNQHGRGLGTYGMKMIGEKLLGGSVGFTTSEKEGTTFTLSLPRTVKQI